MSVLVKGMKMPSYCGDGCDFLEPMGFKCLRLHRFLDREDNLHERPKDCPLVEIPEPHGDLIDRDALDADICPDWNGLYVPDNAYSEKLIYNAPTVIPREDGEDE